MLKPMYVLLTLLVSAASPQQPAAIPAVIPAEAAAMTNPVKPTAESQAHARKMFGYDCAMCHGATGDGKGELADPKAPLKNFTDLAALQNRTDGELYYIIKNGKGNMPPEGDRGKSEDLWNMVIYVRSLSRK